MVECGGETEDAGEDFEGVDVEEAGGRGVSGFGDDKGEEVEVGGRLTRILPRGMGSQGWVAGGT